MHTLGKNDKRLRLLKIGLATFCKDLLLNLFLKNGTSFIAIYHTLEYSTSNTGGELLLLRNTLHHWLVALPDSTRKGGSCLLQLQNSSCIQEFIICMKEHQTSIINHVLSISSLQNSLYGFGIRKVAV